MTEYESDFGPIPAFGTITHITQPTGGVTNIGYRLKTFFFVPGNPAHLYAVDSVTRGGHAWTYDYPDSSQPSQPDFKVDVRADQELVGTYTYYTYSTANACDPNMWKVGTLMHSTEVWNSTVRERTLSYDPFTFSTTSYIPNCNQPPRTPRLTSEIVTRDGFQMTTTYSQFDTLSFPAQVDSPGRVRTILTHPPCRHTLGLLDRWHSSRGGTGKQCAGVPNRDALPKVERGAARLIDFYSNRTNSVQVQLSYFGNGLGKKGALQSKSYGRYNARYDYQNGVLNSAVFAEGPVHLTCCQPEWYSEERDPRRRHNRLWMG